jgi:hypothetical protein
MRTKERINLTRRVGKQMRTVKDLNIIKSVNHQTSEINKQQTNMSLKTTIVKTKM